MLNNISEIIPIERIKYDETLASHTSFNIGGPADIFVTIENEDELAKVIEFAKTENKITSSSAMAVTSLHQMQATEESS